MESLVYMFLTLPHSLGGYGLGDAVFNYEIRLKGKLPFYIKQRSCFADLYYKQAKFAVEYESFTYHSRPQEQGRDAIRSTILNRQGVKILHMNTIQLYDIDACNDFAHTLATRLRKRIYIRTKDFEKMHTQMRELLPRMGFEKMHTQMRELLPRMGQVSKAILTSCVTAGHRGLDIDGLAGGEL